TVTIRGDEKEPVVAKLGPVASITGRLRDVDGNPLARATVSIDGRTEIFDELYRFAEPSGSTVTTDAEGKFSLTGVVPGMTFFLAIREGERPYGGNPKIGPRRLKPGETLYLGDRT